MSTFVYISYFCHKIKKVLWPRKCSLIGPSGLCDNHHVICFVPLNHKHPEKLVKIWVLQFCLRFLTIFVIFFWREKMADKFGDAILHFIPSMRVPTRADFVHSGNVLGRDVVILFLKFSSKIVWLASEISDQNRTKFWWKIGILMKNRNFDQKSKFWSKIEILIKNRNLDQKSKFWSMIELLKKSKFCLEINMLIQNLNAAPYFKKWILDWNIICTI